MKPLLLAVLLSVPAAAVDLDFREAFADPDTRQAALAELVPGTRDWFFHRALHQQLAGDADAFAATMTRWRAAADRDRRPVPDDGYDVLRTRELLLRYEAQPEKNLAALIEEFGLRFDDDRPDAREVENLDDTLDPTLVSADAFERRAAESNRDEPWRDRDPDRLLADLDETDSFSEARVRHYLSTLTQAQPPGVVDLVARGLALESPVNFGDVALHENLTLDQLESLLERHPELRGDRAFVTTSLKKLRTASDTDFARDPGLHAAHLARCREAVADLPPALGSLKAHVLFHHLRLQRRTGEVAPDDFLAYLAIPRSGHTLIRDTEDITNHISLDRDCRDITGCPPVGDDTALVRELLLHFLADADSAERFVPYIERDALTRIHARARLLAGGDPDRWGRRLDPAEFASLREETRVDFAPGKPVLLDADEDAKLTLDLKNTPELAIRIHELDLPAILRRQGNQPTAGMDLAGLVPHHTRTLRFDQPPLVRHRETIALPELKGAGAWIVEFVAEGHACRALVRKGRLVPYLTRTATGQRLRVFDESGAPVRDATLTLGSETFEPNDEGVIEIPNTNAASSRDAVLATDRLARAIDIDDRADRLALDTRIHLDREQLRADAEARARIRLRLTNHGRALPLDLVENARLTLSATLAGGVTTEHVVSENLDLAPDFTVPFHVPADTVSLTLALDATVVPRDGAEPIELGDQATFEFNSLLKGLFTHAHFTRTPEDGHVLELRGRNGEPLAERAVTFSFRHDDYNSGSSITVRLRTDADGRVRLGTLDGIRSVEAIHDGNTLAKLGASDLRPVTSLRGDLRVAAGETIALPLDPPLTRARYGLVSLDLDDTPRADRYDRLAAEDGRLVIDGLEPGVYRLDAPSGTTRIEVIDGEPRDGLFVRRDRIAPHRPAAAPATVSAEAGNDAVTVRIAGTTPETRVHLVGTRFLHPWNDWRALASFAEPADPALAPGFTGCAFLTGRTLDEETRYILDRRAAEKFPGAMLPRAGLLAHRWTEKESKDEEQRPDGGSGGLESGDRGSGRSTSGGIDGFAPTGESHASGMPDYLDYLARSSELRYNLEPDDDGRVSVPFAAFDGCQLVHVVVAGPGTFQRRTLTLPANPIPLRDRRLARPLDPEKHHVGTRRAAVLEKGAEAAIENMLDADWRAFTTLTEAHEFLYGTTRSKRVRDFSFLLDWPDHDEETKLARWSEHACHELHLFLARKDREFFEKHVEPMLAEKREPAFIDDLLLDRDLTPYLRPYAWQRLNAAEKALLARHLPDARERVATELEHRWDLEAPEPEQETVLFTQTLRGTDLATKDSLGLARREDADRDIERSAGATYLKQKLRDIVIPVIDFENTSLEEAIDFLRSRSVELDDTTLDPQNKGINFVRSGSEGASAPRRIDSLNLRNVPMAEVLDYISEATGMYWTTDEYAVRISPADEANAPLASRDYRVPPDFLERLAPSSPSGTTIKDVLQKHGVTFPRDARASFFPRTEQLLVRNTPANLDLIDQLIQSVVSGIVESTGGQSSDRFAADEDPPLLPAELEPETLPFAPLPSWSAERNQTRVWLGANYYRHRGGTGESLIPLNAFWLDLARWDGEGRFLSPHFNACTRSANEALMCLALLDLPFDAGRPDVEVDGPSLRVKAREPMLLYYKDTRETDEVAPDAPVLVRQTFHRLDDRFRTESGRRVENTITGGFRTGVAYGSSLVVTNPTGAGRRIDVLAQIPAGAIPLSGKEATLSATRELEPYGVLTFDLAFYFPEPGEFAAYPLQVAEDDTILASADERVLEVTDAAPPEDRASWKVIARDGSDAEALERLRGANLHALNLDRIAWRLRDRDFYDKAVPILRERLTLPQSLARYAFLHDDEATMSTWLENSDRLTGLGAHLDSPLLDIRPAEHLGWRSLEFDPLVNPRAHRLGDRPWLTQPAALEHYRAFLQQLAWKPELSDEDELHLTWFLFLQDRVGEALARFDEIEPANLSTTLAYDYLHALALFHRSEPRDAKAVAEQHADLPPGPWRERFDAVRTQAEEIAALSNPEPESRSGDAEDEAVPSLDLTLGDDGDLRLKHRRLEAVELSLYQIDLEMLFSRNPFLRDAGELPGTRPNLVREVELSGGETAVDLPEDFRRGNVLVAADAGAAKSLRILDSRALDIDCRRADPVLSVRDSETGAPVSAAYVKVYVERDGRAEFHKDGYTDLRGGFDYRTLTDGSPPPSGRIALLVTHPDKGSRTLILD